MCRLLRVPAVLVLSVAALGVGRRAEAVDTCAACVAAGGVWFEEDSFCMKKLEPILGPVLEPIPEEPIEFELIPGNFNDAPGMSGYPDAIAPVMIGGHELDIHDAFVISETGQHTISDTSGDPLHSFVLGPRQMAFGALADWNAETDLLLFSILELTPGSGPDLYDITPTGNSLPVTLPGVGDFAFSVSFTDVLAVPEPSALSACGVLFALAGLRARRR